MARGADPARPPDRAHRAGLARLLLSIAVVSGTVYCGFWAAWTWKHLDDERASAQAGVHRSAERAVNAFAGFLDEQTEATQHVAAAIDPAALARPECSLELPNDWPPGPGGTPIGRYDLVRTDGTVLCTTARAGRVQPAYDDRGAPWLAAGYVPGSRTSSYHDTATGRPVWAVAVPVGSGSPSGLLAAVADLRPSATQLRQLFEDDSGTEYLVYDTATGEVLSRPDGSSWLPDQPDGRIVDSEPVPTTTWRLAAGVKRSAAYAQTWAEVRRAGYALAATMAALALATGLVHRSIVRPLGAITAAARNTAQGGRTTLDEAGPSELAELASALNDHTASRAQSDKLLKVAAEHLSHSLERLDAVLANSADMVLIVDADGIITFASPAAAAVCGPSARPGVGFTSLVHPDDAASAAALLRRGAADGDAKSELRMGGATGSWRHVEMVARDLLSHEAVRGVVLNGRDVTDRLAEAAERAVLDEQLHQSQRLESLGALAGGIAHDFKNLLSVIVWTTDMVIQHPAAAALVDDLDEIRSAASRGVELAQQLLTFARRDDALPEPIDVGVQLVALAELLRRTLGTQVELDLRLEPHLPAVRLNQSRFDQAVVNLAVNARDAMTAGGRLVVEACVEQVARADGGLAAGSYVVVAVSDTGEGMSSEVAGRAMEPFFTTKGAGRGTGLGLAIVHGIVAGAGGAVRIESTPEEGTAVRLYLPASTESTVSAGADADLAPVLGAGEVVLVVEDDDALRALVERMLRAGNYDAVCAADPREALSLARRPEQRLDIVLTDVLMPGMSGADLAARLGSLRPGLPVIYMSAYSADILEELLEAGAAPVMLEKPFSQRQLLDALQAALAAVEAAAG